MRGGQLLNRPGSAAAGRAERSLIQQPLPGTAPTGNGAFGQTSIRSCERLCRTAPARRFSGLSMIVKILQFGTLIIAISIIGDAAAAEKLNLNTATAAELRALPGIGPERAEMILRVRKKSGPFRSIEELIAIPRLTRRQFERLKKKLFVDQERLEPLRPSPPARVRSS